MQKKKERTLKEKRERGREEEEKKRRRSATRRPKRGRSRDGPGTGWTTVHDDGRLGNIDVGLTRERLRSTTARDHFASEPRWRCREGGRRSAPQYFPMRKSRKKSPLRIRRNLLHSTSFLHGSTTHASLSSFLLGSIHPITPCPPTRNTRTPCSHF